MSPRLARLVAVPFMLLAFALRSVGTFWIDPLTWRIDPDALGTLAWFGFVAASAGLPLAGYLLITRRARRRPTTWQVDRHGRRFVAPAAPRWIGPCAVLLGWLAGGLISTELVPTEDRLGIAEDAAFSVAAAGTVLAIVTVLLLVDRPHLTLGVDEIVLRQLITAISFSWAELAPGGPAARKLPTDRLQIDPAFLAHTIGHYVEHPHRRCAIGTEAELTALQSAFQRVP